MATGLGLLRLGFRSKRGEPAHGAGQNGDKQPCLVYLKCQLFRAQASLTGYMESPAPSWGPGGAIVECMIIFVWYGSKHSLKT